MGIISDYQQLGSHRGAAQLCGTTHKTVKRVVENFETGDTPPTRVERAHNYDAVTDLVTEAKVLWRTSITAGAVRRCGHRVNIW
jgi:hypothetical protein